MFGFKDGEWRFWSKTDPRWNSSGRGSILTVFDQCPEAQAVLDKKKKELGQPPADLTYSCMKD